MKRFEERERKVAPETLGRSDPGSVEHALALMDRLTQKQASHERSRCVSSMPFPGIRSKSGAAIERPSRRSAET